MRAVRVGNLLDEGNVFRIENGLRRGDLLPKPFQFKSLFDTADMNLHSLEHVNKKVELLAVVGGARRDGGRGSRGVDRGRRVRDVDNGGSGGGRSGRDDGGGDVGTSPDSCFTKQPCLGQQMVLQKKPRWQAELFYKTAPPVPPTQYIRFLVIFVICFFSLMAHQNAL